MHEIILIHIEYSYILQGYSKRGVTFSFFDTVNLIALQVEDIHFTFKGYAVGIREIK